MARMMIAATGWWSAGKSRDEQCDGREKTVEKRGNIAIGMTYFDGMSQDGNGRATWYASKTTNARLMEDV